MTKTAPPPFRFVSFGHGRGCVTLSHQGEQQTWYAGTAQAPFVCPLTGLRYYAGGPMWSRPDSGQVLSEEGVYKLSTHRL
jgi:hypothetical protein